MGALDPLKFAIQIEDNATEQLKKIKSQLEQTLSSGLKINLNSANIDTSAIDKAVKAVKDGLEGATSGLTGNNFTLFASSIKTAAEHMELLAKASEKFNIQLNGNQSMKDFITTLNQQIMDVSKAIAQLNNVKNLTGSGSGSAGKGSDNIYNQNLEKTQAALYKIEEAQNKVNKAIADGKASGAVFDEAKLQGHLVTLDGIRQKIDALRSDTDAMSKTGATTQVLGADYKKSLTDATAMQREVKAAIKEVEKAEKEAAKEAERMAKAQAWAEKEAANAANNYAVNLQKVNSALQNIQQARANVSGSMKDPNASPEQISGMKIYLQLLDQYEKKLQNIKSNPFMMHGTGWQSEAFGPLYRSLTGNSGDFQKQIDGLDTNQRRYNNALTDSVALWERLDAAMAKSQSLNLDTTKVSKASQEIQDFINKLMSLDSSKASKHTISELNAEFSRLKSSLSAVAREQEKLNTATINAADKKQKADTKKAQKDNEAWAASMNKAAIEAKKLTVQIERLRAVETAGQKAGVNTSNLSVRIAELEQYKNAFDRIANGFKGFGHTSDILGSAGYKGSLMFSADEAEKVQAAMKGVSDADKQAAKDARQLSDEEMRLAQAMRQASNEGTRHSQILSDLKSLATQYLGVWGGQQFLNNIIEIGGQLEMQRMSIGAILQDTAQANVLFEQIKGLAVKSPFGVVELDQMTKKLTAYGFKYNELYDMTRRLADISAATGTGVDRLALALGHVRSEAALSGYTLRQFSMGNIPLLEKLSEKLGKTTKEIRKMVRTKDISYQDVVGVLKDLTDEGGMFYNMQEVMSASVKAKFKNVKDAMDIMYGELAESGIGKALGSVADKLMVLTKRWRDVGSVLIGTVGVWGISRMAMLAHNAILGSANATAIRTVNTFVKQEKANLRSARAYRTLTNVEKSYLANKRQLLISSNAVALTEKKLTVEQLARQVALGKLTKQEALQVINMAKLTGAERSAAQATILATKTYGAFTGVINGTKMAVFGLGAALKTLFLNPMMWVMAAVSSVMYLWQKNKREMEAAAELNDNIYNKSQEALKNTQSMMRNTGIGVSGNIFGKDELTFTLPEFNREDAQAQVEEWAQYIREYAGTPNEILNKALFDESGNVLHLAEQFENLKDRVIEVVEAQRLLQQMGPVFENAQISTNTGIFNGLLNDDIIENMKDYAEWEKKTIRTAQKFYNNNRQMVDAAFVNGMGSGIDGFVEASKKMQTNMQKIIWLFVNSENLDTLRKELMSYMSVVDFAGYSKIKLGKHDKTLAEDIELFYKGMLSNLEASGFTLDDVDASEALQQAILLGLNDFLNQSDLTGDKRKGVFSDLAARLHLKVDADTENIIPELDEVRERLKAMSESDWDFIDYKPTELSNDFIDQTRKAYKDAKDYFENVKPVMLKFGFKMELGGADIPLMAIEAWANTFATPKEQDAFRDLMLGYNNANKEYKAQLEIARKLGLKLEDDKNGKGSGGDYKAEWEKRWDERIRVMKETYDWYDKWEKKVGKDEAFNKVNEKYGDIFKEWEQFGFKFEANDVTDYLSFVKKIRDEAFALYQQQKNDADKNNGQEALRVYRQAVAILTDADMDNFKKAAEEFSSKIKKTLDDMQNRWDLFNSIKEATNDENLAYQIAGISGDELNARNMADAIRMNLEKTMREAGFGSVPLDITFDKELIRKNLEDALEVMMEGVSEDDKNDKLIEYAKRIEGIIELYQEWQKVQRDLVKSDAQAFGKLIGSISTYDKQVSDIDAQAKNQKESYARLMMGGYISSYDMMKAFAMVDAKTNYDKLKLSAEYANAFNHALSMTDESFKIATDAIEDAINRMRESGQMTDDEYESNMKNLRDAQRSRRSGAQTDFWAFLTGGDRGRADLHYDRYFAALRSGDEKTAESELKLAEKADNTANAMDKLTTAIGKAQQAMNFMSDFFASIGAEDLAFAFGSNGVVGSTMSGVQSGAAFGPWGAAIGGIMGMVSGAFNMAARQREKQIEEYQRQMKHLQNLDKNLAAIKQRSYGYAKTGKETSREMYDIWMNSDYSSKVRTKYSKETGKAAHDAFITDSAYMAEYASLLAQRDEMTQRLNGEKSDKNGDEEEIENLTQQLAELDEQIAGFSEDIAKELWGIDVKGWADQISDALVTAFENGEDAAKAYKDVVSDIMRSVASEMIKIGLIEPMMEELADKLFGKKGADGKRTGGAVSTEEWLNNPGESAKTIAETIKDYFDNNDMVGAVQSAWDELNNTFSGRLSRSNSNTLSASIQGTSEETSSLLAGYVNAMRQDTAAQRLLQDKFISQMWPDFREQYAAQATAVQNIDTNVRLIMMMMRQGSGAMYDKIDSIDNRLRNVTDGTSRVYIQ